MSDLSGNAKTSNTIKGKVWVPDTIHGLSAYEIAVVNGFVGTQAEWLASLKGEQGRQGIQGLKGEPGPQGEKGDAFTYEDFTAEQLAALRGEKGEDGKDAVTDQTYNAESENAQSGKAVAKALKEYDVRNNILDYIEYTILDGMVTITKCDASITGSHIIPNIIEGCIVTSIGDKAFQYCDDLTSITIPDSVTSIGEYAFGWCFGLTSVTIPDSVTSIGNSAFRNCTSLTSITIPDSVTSIGEWAFYGCDSLASVRIGDGVTSIDRFAFYECFGLASVAMGKGITNIDMYAFQGCINLTIITIPDGVTNIDDYAFYNCSGLTSIIIPDSVVHIGGSSFRNCEKLTDVYYKGTQAQWNSINFDNDVGLDNATIHYDQEPATKKDVYENTTSVDQTYNAESENAQSGKAVAESVKYKMPKVPIGLQESNAKVVVLKSYPSLEVAENGTFYPADSDYEYIATDETFGEGYSSHCIARRDDKGNLRTGTPIKEVDCANKKYVDELISKSVPKVHNYHFAQKGIYAQPEENSESVEPILLKADYTNGFMDKDTENGGMPDGNYQRFAGNVPIRQSNGNLVSGTPTKAYDVANKEYVDNLVGDIETLLGGI